MGRWKYASNQYHGFTQVHADKDKLSLKIKGVDEETKEINTQGIGLGLHISRRIVREMGGDIICQSTWGQGSKFTFIVRLG